MSITKEHVNNFFQVKNNDKDVSNHTEIPKINMEDVDILETINENTVNNPTPPNTTDTNDTTKKPSKEEKKKYKDSDAEEDATEEKSESTDNVVDNQIDDLEVQALLPEEENIDVTEQDIDKISSRQKRKEKQIKLLIKIFKLLSFHVDTLEDLTNLTFPRNSLTKRQSKKLMDLIPQLKLSIILPI